MFRIFFTTDASLMNDLNNVLPQIVDNLFVSRTAGTAKPGRFILLWLPDMGCLHSPPYNQ